MAYNDLDYEDELEEEFEDDFEDEEFTYQCDERFPGEYSCTDPARITIPRLWSENEQLDCEEE